MEQHLLNGQSKEELIENIIDDHGEAIKRVIFTYVKNYADTDDIFQDFLLKVYNNLDHFKGDSSLKTWLMRIAINKSKDYLRSPIRKIRSLTWTVRSSTQTSEQVLMEKEKRNVILHSILSLPIKYREVIVLRYYRDLSIKEISKTLQVKESTVKTRIMRAKEKLKGKLGGQYLELF
ncbi:sigma-70 family RNA polymerase sigma factor [Radiobacillus deserti]|uniref:Sigma-70 family RNA polymerase sigma factor n=1 Tax=Radiobacillus deserti TaxID=2594883 RepID=A0A516KDR3_9BACI|nr:sigma-70 family RNA polymerase sigma factor [Radiobacillus deserti]QDP39507.1 sigma-70 family RNA polymerase sigma factor [Radiobacillus deserti]